MMYYVYLLKEHQRGQSYFSKRLDNPQLIYTESYTNQKQALEREKQLKKYGSSYTGLLKRIGVK